LLAKKPERDRYTVPWVPKVARVRSFALRRDEFRSDEMEPADEEAARKEAADD
jgi:hypothetical protein